MINFDTLNMVFDFLALNLALIYFGILFFGLFKALNYKPDKNINDMQERKMLELYYIKKQLVKTTSPRKVIKLTKRLDSLENDLILIDNIKWGIDNEEEDCK